MSSCSDNFYSNEQNFSNDATRYNQTAALLRQANFHVRRFHPVSLDDPELLALQRCEDLVHDIVLRGVRIELKATVPPFKVRYRRGTAA